MPVSSTEHLLAWLMAPRGRPQPDAARVKAAEWDQLIADSVSHYLAPQLFRSLSAARPGAIPPAVLQCAFVASIRQKQLMANLKRDLSAVLHVMNEKGIPFILLKGGHLATLVYDDASLRPMADFDLLVHHDELEAAEEALVSIGYVSEREGSIADSCKLGRHLPPLQKPGAIPVEAHWTLAHPDEGVMVEVDGLWERSAAATICGEPARVLSNEDLFLYTCLHAGLHRFDEKGLRPLIDILTILDHCGPALDWPAIESRAKQWGAERQTYLILEIARQSCSAAVPEELLRGLRPRRLPAAVVRAARAQMLEVPGVNLKELSIHAIASAWSSPRFLFSYLFRRRKTSGQAASATQAVQGVFAKYGGFVWRMLRGDAGKLARLLRRTRRHVVLNQWLRSR